MNKSLNNWTHETTLSLKNHYSTSTEAANSICLCLCWQVLQQKLLLTRNFSGSAPLLVLSAARDFTRHAWSEHLARIRTLECTLTLNVKIWHQSSNIQQFQKPPISTILIDSHHVHGHQKHQKHNKTLHLHFINVPRKPQHSKKAPSSPEISVISSLDTWTSPFASGPRPSIASTCSQLAPGSAVEVGRVPKGCRGSGISRTCQASSWRVLAAIWYKNMGTICDLWGFRNVHHFFTSVLLIHCLRSLPLPSLACESSLLHAWAGSEHACFSTAWGLPFQLTYDMDPFLFSASWPNLKWEIGYSWDVLRGCHIQVKRLQPCSLGAPADNLLTSQLPPASTALHLQPNEEMLGSNLSMAYGPMDSGMLMWQNPLHLQFWRTSRICTRDGARGQAPV